MNHSVRHDWHFVPDACFERILSHLPPRSIASLRLVSRSWRDQVSHTLSKLVLKSECDLETVPPVFPNLCTLSLTFTSITGSSGAPSLEPLVRLRSLINLTLTGPDTRPQAAPIQLPASALVQAAASPRLLALTLVKVSLNWTCPWLSGLADLTKLQIHGVKFFRGAQEHQQHDAAGFASMLGALRHLACLEIAEASALEKEISPNEDDEISFASQFVASVSTLKYLKHVRLGSIVPITREMFAALASLPRLSSLHISLPDWTSILSISQHASESGIETNGLAVLKARASTLQRLVLHGCPPTAIATVPHIAALTSLTSLELCTLAEEEHVAMGGPPMRTVEARYPCWARLSSLQRLQELHLSGWPLGTAAARAIGRIPSLTRLEFSNCWNLADGAAFELAKMGSLCHLGLRQCPAVSDIGLAALAKGRLARNLRVLDLTGCHRNVTDQGVAALHDMPCLVHLDLTHCDLVTDVGMEAALPGLRRLTHLFLSDTQVSDYGCILIASNAPRLRAVALEHCPKVTDRGTAAFCLLSDLQEVRVFGSCVTSKGAKRLVSKTGAEVMLQKPCWWSKEGRVASPAVEHQM